MSSSKVGKLLLLASVVIFSSGITQKSNAASLNETKFTKLAGWTDDDHGQAIESFKQSCYKFSEENDRDYLHKSKIGGRFGDWKDICAKVLNNETGDAKQFFETYFKPFTVNNEKEGLFTGYFQATLNGSYTKSEKYKYPVYGKPKDLVSGRKYLTRKKIQDGALEGKGLELLWVDDAVDLFFMHVQGSGMVNMDDGSSVKLGYAAKNNHEYTSIAREMINDGLLDGSGASAETVKAWFKENPTRVNEVLAKNKAYIFFQKGKNADEGPIGSQGVPLTAMRSIAVDKNRIPYGVPMWLDVQINKFENKPESEKRLKSLVVAQDTGSAIKGDVRADIFFGFGKEAEQIAGVQQGQGKYYMLLPRPKDEIYIEEPIIQVASAELEAVAEPIIVNENIEAIADQNVTQEIVEPDVETISVANIEPETIEPEAIVTEDSKPEIEQLQIASSAEVEEVDNAPSTTQIVNVEPMIDAMPETQMASLEKDATVEAIAKAELVQEQLIKEQGIAPLSEDELEYEIAEVYEVEIIDNEVANDEVVEVAQIVTSQLDQAQEEMEMIESVDSDVVNSGEIVAPEIDQIEAADSDFTEQATDEVIVAATDIVKEPDEVIDEVIVAAADVSEESDEVIAEVSNIKDGQIAKLESEAKEELKQDISNLRVVELKNKIDELKSKIAKLQSQIEAAKAEIEFEMQSDEQVSSLN